MKAMLAIAAFAITVGAAAPAPVQVQVAGGGVDARSGATRMPRETPEGRPSTSESDSAIDYYEAGAAMLEAGRAQEAIVRFDRAIEIDPEMAKAYYGRGRASLKLGHDADALGDFDRALALDPEFGEGYYVRARTLMKRGENARAVDDLGRAIPLLGAGQARLRAAALYSLGTIMLERGELDAAIDAFAGAIEAMPEYPAFWRARADALERAGRKAEAEADRERARSLGE